MKYDWEWRDGKPISGGEPWPSRWLASLIGIDYFGHVIEVNVSLAGKSDEVILQVARLDRLQHLDFHYPAVGDVELAQSKAADQPQVARSQRVVRSPMRSCRI